LLRLHDHLLSLDDRLNDLLGRCFGSSTLSFGSLTFALLLILEFEVLLALNFALLSLGSLLSSELVLLTSQSQTLE
jgi:hypothetical protein